MTEPGSKIIGTLLGRLYANLVNGPLMSCRPHASRQRVDLFQLAKLKGPEPRELIAGLLGRDRTAKLSVPSDAERAEKQIPASEGSGVITKLRGIIEDARTYEEETGTQALYLGFPLLNLPPDTSLPGTRSTKRILAPVAFLPLRITVQATRPATILLEATGDGADLLVPNSALVAWVERMTGKDLGELFADEEAADPWRELNEIVAAVTKALELSRPDALSPESTFIPTPRSDSEDAKQPTILNAAVIGLFPAANQGLLRDLEALQDGEGVTGPIESFLKARTDFSMPRGNISAEPANTRAGTARCVSDADPCQARAVYLARTVSGLVIHGPPGTGKSQTITNIIGDHLANGERVLFVCDKRTALDVVSYRLDRLGLGSFCAVVHDARRDQRDLYRSIREQLDTLPGTGTHDRAVAELELVDREIERIHSELTRFDAALSNRPEGIAPSFHELVGSWFALEPTIRTAEEFDLSGVPLDALVSLESVVKEAGQRGKAETYPSNPWVLALSTDLSTFLSRPLKEWERRLRSVAEAGSFLDATIETSIVPFATDTDARQQGDARRKLGELVGAALEVAPPRLLMQWLRAPRVERTSADAALQNTTSHADLVSIVPDSALTLAISASPTDTELVPWLSKLGTYLSATRKWYALFLFGTRRAARKILEKFGLTLSEESAKRVAEYLTRLRSRRLLAGVVAQLTARSENAFSDAELIDLVAQHSAVFRATSILDENPALASSAAALVDALTHATEMKAIVEGLRSDEARGNAITRFEEALEGVELFSGETLHALRSAARHGEPVADRVGRFLEYLPSIEGLLRLDALLLPLDAQVAKLVRELLARGSSPDESWTIVKGLVTRAEIARRLQTDPVLLDIDGDRVAASYQRYRDLNARRRELSRDLARHTWVTKQRSRLLVSTGSRLKPEAAHVKARLVTRGARAKRVRQMIAAGVDIAGGDPLFDLRPVWMASPDVVAQIFPRQPIFDVIIFDEASQCRLEEALPVLLRGRRVVIAGDPQQLPPTRFFESALVQSQDEEPEDEQQWFEAQQSENEDLLSAALSLSVEQAYLDVHYRSKNADLIHFSNQQFYDSRLQAIPAHPSRRSESPPLRLVQVGGVYENRRNSREAREVTEIVKRLLSEESPPSIGIACFNLAQRDLIIDTLDRAAADDDDFAKQLARARARQGAASFEGLFVRNLESVQGDERDHIIISTTFGPNPYGKFRRNFGPLGQAGGGRRLNVLVTRARSMVHLVTSIPKEQYQSRPELPAGTKPSGAMLLFEYLAYAASLQQLYEDAAQRIHARSEVDAQCIIEDAQYPSELAQSIGRHLESEHKISSVVHWGNDGFGVDAALLHPESAEDVTIGVLCDGARFDKVADRVQWDIFRTEMLEAQRWRLHRLWSPHFFRDPSGAIAKLKKAAQEWLAEESESQAVETSPAASEDPMLN